MSAQLKARGVPHLVLERHRIAERWRTERWDSLVANGPAWHDRFPGLEFSDLDPHSFAPKDRIVAYFEDFARQVEAPVRCGVEVRALTQGAGGFRAETSGGVIEARQVVVATGPFQKPVIPTVVPAEAGLVQMHSSAYRNPGALPSGAVLVVGAGSSGAQIADELQRSGRQVYLSVGPHDRPPRAYRGKDFVWWLGKLGHWDATTREPGMEHVTIAVSGGAGRAYGGFPQACSAGHGAAGAGRGLYGWRAALCHRSGPEHRARGCALPVGAGYGGCLCGAGRPGPAARARGAVFLPDPECMTRPVLSLDLAGAGITSIIWATGYVQDFGWLQMDAFDDKGRPRHLRGVAEVPGLYFLGLPWLARRASPFIWGVWHDADYLAERITERGRVSA